MTDKLKVSMTGTWLLVSSVCLLLPIFLPSRAFSGNPFENVIGSATATMFILSFPSSLFGIPLLMIVDLALGVDANSLSGMCVNLFLLFVLGLVQWFWVVPRVWRRDPPLQILEFTAITNQMRSAAKHLDELSCPLDADGRTPLERVLSDETQ